MRVGVEGSKSSINCVRQNDVVVEVGQQAHSQQKLRRIPSDMTLENLVRTVH